jgi:hypothetical protein
MTPEQLEALHTGNEAEFARLVNAEFKRNFKNDPEHRDLHGEILRAKWVLFTNKEGNWTTTLSKYLVKSNVIQMLTGEQVSPERRERRSDKYQKLIDWCKENHLVQITPAQLAEVGCISYPTALKFIADRPDLLVKIKRGIYECRNPEIVRKEEKAQNK